MLQAQQNLVANNIFFLDQGSFIRSYCHGADITFSRRVKALFSDTRRYFFLKAITGSSNNSFRSLSIVSAMLLKEDRGRLKLLLVGESMASAKVLTESGLDVLTYMLGSTSKSWNGFCWSPDSCLLIDPSGDIGKGAFTGDASRPCRELIRSVSLWHESSDWLPCEKYCCSCESFEAWVFAVDTSSTGQSSSDVSIHGKRQVNEQIILDKVSTQTLDRNAGGQCSGLIIFEV